MAKDTSYSNKFFSTILTLLLCGIFLIPFAQSYDGFALYEYDEDSTIYLYDAFGQYVNYINTLDHVNEDCNDVDAIYDIDGSDTYFYTLSTCGKLTKFDVNKTVKWSYQLPTNDTDERFIDANENHVLITNSTNFTLVNADDGSHNITRQNNYSVFPEDVELTKQSTLLIAEQSLDSIIELDIVDNTFVNLYSPFFLEQVWSLSYDPVNESIFIVHGGIGTGTYWGGDGDDYIKWDPKYVTLIDRDFNTKWSFDDGDNEFTNYDMNDAVLYECDSGYGYTRQYLGREYSYNGKHYVMGAGDISGSSNCEDGFGDVRVTSGTKDLATFGETITYPIDQYSAEDHYISDYTNFSTINIGFGRDELGNYRRGLDDTFIVLDSGTGTDTIVALKDDYSSSSLVNITLGYQTGYTGYELIKEYEVPYPSYSDKRIRIAKIPNILGVDEDEGDTVGGGVRIKDTIPDQYTETSSIILNMSEYFFNYTDMDISFFNDNTSWEVTLDKNIDDGDAWYNDSTVNYSLKTSGGDLFFKIDPFAYYDGEHLNTEVVVQAYRNDSSDFAEQRFNLRISRDDETPPQDPVELNLELQDITSGYNETIPITMTTLFDNANTYLLEWYDRDTQTQHNIRDTVFDHNNKFETDNFKIWFSVDDLGRKTLYFQSKDNDYYTGFTLEGIDYESGFGIVSQAETSFSWEINGNKTYYTDEPETSDLIDNIMPDSEGASKQQNWVYGVLVMIVVGGLGYYALGYTITGGIIGVILGFGLSIAFGYIPVTVIVIAVLGIIGFIYLRSRG